MSDEALIGPAATDGALADAPARPAPTLKARTLRASAWAIIGYGGSTALRFVVSVLVTYLVDKDALGVTVIASAIMTGLTMFSDLGLGPSIVQNERGDDPRFRNTAWTIQVIRGFVLALAAVSLAWPFAAVYDEPRLLQIIPVLALTSIISGFYSTSIFILQRHLAMSRVVGIELGAIIGGSAVTVGLAFVTHSLWAVVIGWVVGNSVKLALSHLAMPSERNRFVWDRDAVGAIVRFGKWIFLSTAVSFASRQSDRLLLGKLIGPSKLQVYHVAMMISEVVAELASQLMYSVLFPALSRVAPEGLDRLRDVYYRARFRLDACVLVTGGISGAAPWIVRQLYPQGYEDASWMLRALAVRSGMMCIMVPCESLLFAIGHSRYSFIRNCARAVWVLAGLPLGYRFGGLEGVIVVMAMTEVPVMLVLWPAAIRHGVFRLSGEVRSVLVFLAGLGAGLAFLQVAPELRCVVEDLFIRGGTP